MNTQDTPKILAQTLGVATDFLDRINEIPPNIAFKQTAQKQLPIDGLGFEKAMTLFQKQYGAAISASAGANNFSFVVGGATPASIAGDWLTAAYDQVSPATQVSAQHFFTKIKCHRKSFFNTNCL